MRAGTEPAYIPLSAHGSYAVAVTEIIRSGWSRIGANPGVQNFIDLRQTQASGVQALNEVIQNALQALRQHPEMRMLQSSAQWGRAERERYEALSSNAIAQAFHQHRLLRNYRWELDEQGVPSVEARGNNARNLTHLTLAHELDCDGMSMLKGIMQHRIERALLSPVPPGASEWRHPQEYYVAGANVLFGSGMRGAPAAILSSATGNLIEATYDYAPYHRAEGPYAFRDFVAGIPFIGRRSTIQARERNDDERQVIRFGHMFPDADIINRRSAAFDRGDMRALRQPEALTPYIGAEAMDDHFARARVFLESRANPNLFSSGAVYAPEDRATPPTAPLRAAPTAALAR
jgi:hypothetical protein